MGEKPSWLFISMYLVRHKARKSYTVRSHCTHFYSMQGVKENSDVSKQQHGIEAS